MSKVNKLKETFDNKNEMYKTDPGNGQRIKRIKSSGDSKELKVKVKGKVTNIQTLKEFLAKADRVERGSGKSSDSANSAESRTRPAMHIQRESRTIPGENSDISNLRYNGTKSETAKGVQLDKRQL